MARNGRVEAFMFFKLKLFTHRFQWPGVLKPGVLKPSNGQCRTQERLPFQRGGGSPNPEIKPWMYKSSQRKKHKKVRSKCQCCADPKFTSAREFGWTKPAGEGYYLLHLGDARVMSHFQELTALLVERKRIPMKQYGAHFTVEDNQGHDWNEASNYQSSNFKTSCQAYKPTCLISG